MAAGVGKHTLQDEVSLQAGHTEVQYEQTPELRLPANLQLRHRLGSVAEQVRQEVLQATHCPETTAQ